MCFWFRGQPDKVAPDRSVPVKSAPSAVQPDRSEPLKSAEERSQFERFVDACGWIKDDVIDCGGHSECILPLFQIHTKYCCVRSYKAATRLARMRQAPFRFADASPHPPKSAPSRAVVLQPVKDLWKTYNVAQSVMGLMLCAALNTAVC